MTMIRKAILLLCMVCLTLSCGNSNTGKGKIKGGQDVAQDDTTEALTEADDQFLEKGLNLMKAEKAGELQIGMRYEQVVDYLGGPGEITEPEMSQIDGSLCQSVDYPEKGVHLVFNIESDSVRRIMNILIIDPCTLKTTKQIGIGSTINDVKNAYSEAVNPELSDSTEIVAGTSYGGVVFDFRNNKVRTIYIGVTSD
jgi:hypothetical protein